VGIHAVLSNHIFQELGDGRETWMPGTSRNKSGHGRCYFGAIIHCRALADPRQLRIAGIDAGGKPSFRHNRNTAAFSGSTLPTSPSMPRCLASWISRVVSRWPSLCPF
jgi:hypothetical protein